jgi:hypothetical protein
MYDGRPMGDGPWRARSTSGDRESAPPDVGFAGNCEVIGKAAHQLPLSDSGQCAAPLHRSGWIHQISSPCIAARFQAITDTGASRAPRRCRELRATLISQIRRPAIGPVRNARGLAALSDPEHLGPAVRAHTLGRRPTIFHGDGLGVLHFPGRSTLDTIPVHINSS